MAILDIIEAPDPRLTTPCAPIEAIDGELQRLLDDMLETMYAAPGIGLAAPQVGVLRRAFVLDLGPEEARAPLFLINPEIIERSATTSVSEEGCLSLPKQFADVARADRVTVRYLDRAGQPQELAADDLLARCLQHEIDHLDGILFVDRISALKRTMILRRAAKARRGRQRESA
jgi:peptide deformylase